MFVVETGEGRAPRLRSIYIQVKALDQNPFELLSFGLATAIHHLTGPILQVKERLQFR